MAHNLGAWMVIWLVNQHGEGIPVDFYNAVDTVSFEENFTSQFSQDCPSAVDDVEVFLSQSLDEVVALLDEQGH